MIFMVVLTILLVAVVAVTAWSALADAKADPPGETPAESAPAATPESLEGVLVRQLFGAEITGLQFQRAMRRLAERDADRHPMSVPPED
jgi:hypothetical protein